MSATARRARRDAPDGRVVVRRDDRQMAQAAGRSCRPRRAAVRVVDRQGGHRRAGAGGGHSREILASEGETVGVGVAVAMIETDELKRPRPRRWRATSAVQVRPPSPRRPEEPGGHFKSTHAPQLVSFRREGGPSTSRPPRPRQSRASVLAAPCPPPRRPPEPLVFAGRARRRATRRRVARAVDELPGRAAAGASPSATSSASWSRVVATPQHRRPSAERGHAQG